MDEIIKKIETFIIEMVQLIVSYLPIEKRTAGQLIKAAHVAMYLASGAIIFMTKNRFINRLNFLFVLALFLSQLMFNGCMMSRIENILIEGSDKCTQQLTPITFALLIAVLIKNYYV